jgi:hypothetical protein
MADETDSHYRDDPMDVKHLLLYIPLSQGMAADDGCPQAVKPVGCRFQRIVGGFHGQGMEGLDMQP